MRAAAVLGAGATLTLTPADAATPVAGTLTIAVCAHEGDVGDVHS